MKIKIALVTLSTVLLVGCEQEKPAPATTPTVNTTTQTPTETKQEPGSTFGNTITAPVDYLGAVAKGKKSAENKIDTTSLTKAIDMFQATEGRYPKDLQELVKEGLIKEVPKDRYGRQLVYDPKTGAVRIDPKPPEPPAAK